LKSIDNDIIKEWDVGFVFGANLDLRIFGQLNRQINVPSTGIAK
jgi:hypothetical protein